jgi:hypothetical protein
MFRVYVTKQIARNKIEQFKKKVMMMISYLFFNAVSQLNSRTTHFWRYINLIFFIVLMWSTLIYKALVFV